MPDSYKEKNYGFRKRYDIVHRSDRRLPGQRARSQETVIREGWRICIPPGASDYLFRLGQDVQDYLARSMQISVLLQRHLPEAQENQVLFLHCDPALKNLPPRSYSLSVTPNRIEIAGRDERGIGQGCYFLEDEMNLRSAPFLLQGKRQRSPLFSPRMTHSGWAIDQFPNAHLNAIAHAGLDAILVFIQDGVDQTRSGYLDLNDLVRRADSYGIDVYLYPLLHCLKHPEDPGAEEYYNQLYGELIKNCPGVKGLILVGESCSFPTRDPHTCGCSWWESEKRAPGDRRPFNGFYPSNDFPQWLTLLKKVTRQYNPELDIVFWTYNWGNVDSEPRLELIRNIPHDITLEATFEMFEYVHHQEFAIPIADYSTVLPGPGAYFSSEAEEAKKQGRKLYAMANTGGLTWDIGVIPYEPLPMRWKMRWDALLKARQDWGLSGLMESHHYGWAPSFISELSKEAYWSSGRDFNNHLQAIAKRDFGDGAEDAIKAWQDWSDAFAFYIPTSMDQYGPFRIGPAYPLLLPGQTPTPMSFSRFGRQIVNFQYHHLPEISSRHLQILAKMERLLKSGCQQMRLASEKARPENWEEAQRMSALGEFMLIAVRTVINTKRWYAACYQLEKTDSKEDKFLLLAELECILKEECGNARQAIPLVEMDSRLGFEPRSGYMADREHIEWKLAQAEDTFTTGLPEYRNKYT